ncbi:hypothetical protein TCE0_011r00599 [Talaromyces pinophilus]|jgi:hypothetical protein|uniref:F-box domain-containing protein n=1 Tax=Talaromyces pinophilus TaxID=128442 RepID=A0A0B8N436_TALPI|nr:hypothetical protein TCE0_011r00599 [Talaromyces pinophilus]
MAGFLSLPLELRSLIYKFLITPHVINPINPWYADDISLLHPKLLYVSKSISREYREIFYSEIRFSFEDLESKSVVRFLDQIGRENAGLIRYIYIDVLQVYPDSYSDEENMDEDSEQILRKIESDCTGLRILTIDFEMAWGPLRRLQETNSKLPFYEVAISVLNRRFRAIPSLQSIKVEIPARGRWTKIISEMEKNGWVIYETGGIWPGNEGIEN